MPIITKLYFTTESAPYTPSSLRGNNWAPYGSKPIYKLGKFPTGTNIADSEYILSSNTPYSFLLSRFVSDALDFNYSFTAADSVNWVRGALTSYPAYGYTECIYITQGDSDTPRGILWDRTNTDSPTYFPLTLSGLADSLSSSQSVSALAGDRIVIEMGFKPNNIHYGEGTGTIYSGGQSETDLTVSDTNMNHPSWINFSTSSSLFNPYIFSRESETITESSISSFNPKHLSISDSEQILDQLYIGELLNRDSMVMLL